ncbi:hypothetical protein PF005_g14853 [Phytophthora fragariae]|nr:hypothetical protein PF011_g12853 [Phytophthora fragariae]KAE9103132.1 hypothetical protein PF007_g14510 [Phytophthora fragariae]KAE9103827.1 hypothetical protein PF010_g13604 [Phytophthora fragariae]KAE9142229.1 hypothetical protein PF006_g12650 [Phytophthora fragariae]KAE9201709.1 hypothetical protein PF005_g14853 [Phytophthora fragariae]
MGETHLDNEMENDGEDGDDSYANAYLDDDDAQESDDAELAEMLAKVQSIQQVEGRLQLAENPVGTDVKGGQGEEAPKFSSTLPPRVTTVGDARKSQPLVKSPSAASSKSTVGVYKSQDGITTIPRSALNARNAGAGALLGIKKTAVYEEKLLQAVKTTNTIKMLRQKAVAAAPATIGKRIETLSAPPLKSTVRKFATDDEEQHCRFQLRKTAKSSSRDDFDSAGESGQNFISRMEAAERNRQKKLDLSRGENDYNARLDKKSCPKCGVPQSYSEFRDKKKKCQMCGVEFRFVNAWGDIEHGFNSRMTEAARAQAERKEQIYAQVTAEETNRRGVTKTTKQLQYEKRIAMKHNKQTFLDRNYTPNGDSKTKKAQLELEAKRKTGKISRE